MFVNCFLINFATSSGKQSKRKAVHATIMNTPFIENSNPVTCEYATTLYPSLMKFWKRFFKWEIYKFAKDKDF